MLWGRAKQINEKKTMKAPGSQEFKFRVSFYFGFDLQVDL
jgi:hypothetical protein